MLVKNMDFWIELTSRPESQDLAGLAMSTFFFAALAMCAAAALGGLGLLKNIRTSKKYSNLNDGISLTTLDERKCRKEPWAK
jgi:hypothetical protein